MTIQVHVNRVDPWSEATGIDQELLAGAARTTLEEAGSHRGGELSVTLVDRNEIRDLNAAWLDRKGPTDVVAFDLGDDTSVLGDVYLCPELALEAVERGEAASAREELVRLVIHGTLHVLGHEHPEGPERWESSMFELQERLVQRVLGGDEQGC
ncbi:MAG: rRNA maturation RNase YbeY [Gemmatimonadota bacterium]